MPQLEEHLLQALLEERRLSEERALIPGLLQHDLSNVLTQVGLASELLAGSAVGPDQWRLARDIRGGIKRMTELLSGMKFLHQTRGGITDYTRGDLAEFITRLALEPGVWPPGPTIKLELPPGMWCSFSPTLVRHALVNLIGNAVAYAHGTWVRVRLSRICGESWQLSVANGGPGIPSDHMPYLFLLKKQPGAARKSERTGLGLYIAHWCLRNHGATLRVRTRPDLTVFAFAVQGLQRSPAPGLAHAIN